MSRERILPHQPLPNAHPASDREDEEIEDRRRAREQASEEEGENRYYEGTL